MTRSLPKRYGPVWELVAEETAGGLTVSTFAKRSLRYDVVASKDRFYQHAWSDFDLPQVCGILCHPNSSFKGHKYVLTAALCSWILDPGRRQTAGGREEQSEGHKGTTRKRAIALAVAELLSNAERRSVKNALHSRFTANRYARITSVSPAFFTELYYPIGGLRTIMRSPTRVWLRKKLSRYRQSIYLSITLAAVEHCHFQAMNAGRTLERASLSKSATLVGIVLAASRNQDAPLADKVDTYHYRYVAKSLPFLYAAQSIDLPDGRSLLDAMMDGDWKIANDDAIASRWFGRALYWVQTVIAPQRRSADDELVAKSLVGVIPESFDPPAYVSDYRGLVEYIHTKGKLVEFNKREDEFWAANGMTRPQLTSKAIGWPSPAVKGSASQRTGSTAE